MNHDGPLPDPEHLQRIAGDLMERFESTGADPAFIIRFVRTIHALHHLPVVLEQYFQQVGLSKARFLVMVHLLHAHPRGSSISSLCDLHPVSPATLTGVVDTLEKEGYVERHPCPEDRRRVMVRLTEAGVRFMESFLPVHYENVRTMMSALSEAEQHTLAELLERLGHHVSNFVDSGQVRRPSREATS